MSSTPISDDDRLLLAAYVDGEMPEADVIAFEARLALDATLFDAVAHERALRAGLAAHYDAVLEEPVPDRLLDLLALPAAQVDDAPTDWPASHAANDSTLAAPAGVVPIRRAPDARARTGLSWQAWGGMAASLAIGIVLGGRALAPSETPAAPPSAAAFAVDDKGALTADGPLRTALEGQVGGSPLERQAGGSSLEAQAGGSSVAAAPGVAIGLSFRDKAQDYCRSFAVESSSGIACKSDGRWTVAVLEHAAAAAASSASAAGDAYRTAASPMSPTLLQAMDALRDGDTLDAAGEAAARTKGWRR